MIYCSNADNYDYYATVATQGIDGGDCTPTSTSSTKSIKQTTYNNADGDESFALLYTNEADVNPSTLTVQMICNKDLDAPQIGDLVSTGTNSWTTTFEGAEACSTVDLSYIWDWLDNNTWLWATILIVTGIAICGFGRIFFKVTVFFVAALAVTFVLLIFSYSTFFKNTTADWVAWVMLVLSIIVGCIVGFLLMKFERIGAALLAGWGGFWVGVLLNEMVLYKVGAPWLFWVVNISCAAIAAVLAFVTFNHVVICMTAFFGAYSFWRGISLFAGGFPNEFTLAKEIQDGVVTSIDGWFYAYMAAIFVTTLVGAFFQYRQFNNMSEEDKHPYARLS